MAMKKAAPKKNGASDRAKKAQAERLRAQSRATNQPKRGKFAAGERMSEQASRTQNKLWINEGNQLDSTALYNKRQLGLAREIASRTKTASQQMRQGVTKSGGYAGSGLGQAYLGEMRRVKSAKFKAEQANKNSPMTRKPANKKKGAR